MTTTTTFFAMRHLQQETSRLERMPKDVAASAFSALMPKDDGASAARDGNLPTPVPTELDGRLRYHAHTPPPSTDFRDSQPRMSSSTPVPTVPEDDGIRTDTSTPVPVVPPQEDAAALTHRLAHSLLTGIEFQFTNIVRNTDGTDS